MVLGHEQPGEFGIDVVAQLARDGRGLALNAQELDEPRRVCRRLICLSYAAMSDLSRAAEKLASANRSVYFIDRYCEPRSE